jgi:hypothetical protein
MDRSATRSSSFSKERFASKPALQHVHISQLQRSAVNAGGASYSCAKACRTQQVCTIEAVCLQSIPVAQQFAPGGHQYVCLWRRACIRQHLIQTRPLASSRDNMEHDCICILHLPWLVEVGVRLSCFVLVILTIPSITYNQRFAEAHTFGTIPCQPIALCHLASPNKQWLRGVPNSSTLTGVFRQRGHVGEPKR